MRIFSTLILVTLLALTAAPAHAWGPRAESAIVTSAAQLLSKEGVLQIQRIEKNLQDGALASELNLNTIYPELAGNPVSAIENEMMLLQSLRGSQIDEYYAYRLGMLGKVVANYTAPLAREESAYKNLYYRDVESNIDPMSLQAVTPQVVDPRVYFERRLLESAVNTDVIIKEYKSGVGFRGVASNTLAEAATRSLASVADVWRTILSARAVETNISLEQQRDYVVEAYRYFLQNSSEAKVLAADRRLSEMVNPNPDMIVRIGDLFYEAGMREEAVRRYESVLAAVPDRRDVIERIAEYYMALGEEALQEDQLEDALEAFGSALDADALHPAAESRRLYAADLIAEREMRLAAAKGALEQAAGLEMLAEQEVLNNRFTESVALLREAQTIYEAIDDEFPLEYQKASTGARQVATRLRSLQGQLMANAQLLSGCGYSLDAPRIASEAGRGIDKETLNAMISDALTSLERDLDAQAEELIRF